MREERFEERRDEPKKLGSRLPHDGDDSHRGSRILFLVLTALLVGIGIWCVVLFSRTVSLRSELGNHMRWMRQAVALRADLEPLAVSTPQALGQASAELETEAPRRLLETSRDFLQDHGAPDLVFDLQRLANRLEHLVDGLESRRRAGSATGVAADLLPTSDEELADAGYAVLQLLPEVEAHVQGHVVDLYAGLDGLWRPLQILVVLCLLLCASNLGLLHLVHRRRLQLATAHREAVALASHDPLTGLWNRSGILRILELELSRADRAETPLGLIFLDLDDFHRLNVRIGSHEADQVLQEVSRRLGAFIRPYDTLGRFGGDSFLVVLPSCDDAATRGVAKRLRRAVDGEHLPYDHGSAEVRATLVSETVRPDDEHDADHLVHRLLDRWRRRRQSQGDEPAS